MVLNFTASEFLVWRESKAILEEHICRGKDSIQKYMLVLCLIICPVEELQGDHQQMTIKEGVFVDEVIRP